LCGHFGQIRGCYIFVIFQRFLATFLLFFGLSDLIVILKIGFWLLALLFSHPAFCADDFTGTGIDPFDQFFLSSGVHTPCPPSNPFKDNKSEQVNPCLASLVVVPVFMRSVIRALWLNQQAACILLCQNDTSTASAHGVCHVSIAMIIKWRVLRYVSTKG
jgi:hypothetical protein